MSIQAMQEEIHGEGFDYLDGSPHLKHRALFDWINDELLHALQYAQDRGLPTTLLDIGAGDGSLDVAPLAYGWNVAAVEESRPSIAAMQRRFASNPKFETIFDRDGCLSGLGARKFSVIMFASVLHHIPDYQRAIDRAVENHLEPGGVLLTFQDPLWYPDQPRHTKFVGRVSYLSWRITQGHLKRGLASQLRRARGTHDFSNPSDMVEYHVVRQGVNHNELTAQLQLKFESVKVLPYWATQSLTWQYLGKRLRLTNMFAIRAQGFRV